MVSPASVGSAALREGTPPRRRKRVGVPARYALETRPEQDPIEIAAVIERELADLNPHVSPLSTLDPEVLVAEVPGRSLKS
jgi:hypothetical protein